MRCWSDELELSFVSQLTGNTKERMTESSAINKSLFVLGQVVQALNAGSVSLQRLCIHSAWACD